VGFLAPELDPYLSDEEVSEAANRESLRAPTVMVTGMPGTGKTTLSTRLAETLRVPMIGVKTVLDKVVEEFKVSEAAAAAAKK
jgi:MoxR-like ATPase